MDPGRVSVSLNQVVRRTAGLRTSLMGPDNCLAVVEVGRGLDHVGIWLLTEEFRQLKSRGIERVVLHVSNKGKTNIDTFRCGRRSTDG